MGLDQRKGQGHARYLGTRELFGRIDIIDIDGTFDVLTNREGLAQTKAFHELIAAEQKNKTSLAVSNDESKLSESYGYVINIIRQLETFVVDALEWNRFIDIVNPDAKKVISDRDLFKDPSRYKLKEISSTKVRAVCKRLLKSNWNIKKIQINEDLIKRISLIAQRKYEDFLNDFLGKVGDKPIVELSSKERATAKRVIQEVRRSERLANLAKEKAEKENFESAVALAQKSDELEKKDKTIEQINSVNTFLKKTSNQDIEDLLVSMHSILVNTSTIKNNILKILESGGIPSKTVDLLARINESNQQNANIAKFATLYNFSDKKNIINGELTAFIEAYLLEASQFSSNRNLKIISHLDLSINVNKEFIPLEIMMLLENILVNSVKAKASEIQVSNYLGELGKTVYRFQDNGKGVTAPKFLDNIECVFEKGETTTNGSGLGLFHVKKIINKLGGEVKIVKYINEFIIEIIL